MIIRHIKKLVQRSLQQFPAVLLIGARQVGKSTLAQQLVQEGVLSDYLTLDDLALLEIAQTDPDGFISRIKKPVSLDEIQRAPDLMRALKKNIDMNRKPGQFLLTGSANILAHPKVTESLAGRMDIIHLEGLSLGELCGQAEPSSFIDLLFNSNTSDELAENLHTHCAHKNSLTAEQLQKIIFYGGFPEIAMQQENNFSQRWFAAYQLSYIERDVRNLIQLTDTISFAKLLRLAGLRTANMLNANNLSAESGIDQRTTSRYLDLLELTFQLQRLHPWYRNLGKRLIKTPKLFLNDSGYACYLAHVGEPERLTQSPLMGAIFETWIFAELRKLLAFTTGIQISFYRSYQGREVDFVLEKGQRCIGIEVKHAQNISRKDFAGLLELQETQADFYGIILYQGDRLIHFAKNLLAVPLHCLL